MRKSDTKSDGRASGRFVLRIDPGLHALLRRAARESGVSLNDYCSRSLALASGPAGSPPALAAAVSRAARLFGEDLVAVAAFGSWCRGEMAGSSDVDLLVVLDRRLRLGRGLYRRWDEAPIVWSGHPLEPQFVHLPDPGLTAGGIWAEVALDGVVLFDRGFALSRRLGRIRRDIAEGRLVRRVIHGQPYWALSRVA